MKLLFYILSLLAIVATAYFSNLNKTRFEEQQKFRIDNLRLNETVSAQADKTEKQLNDEKDMLAEAEKVRAEVVQRIASLEADERELRRELGEIEAELEAQVQKIKDAEEALEEVRKVFADMGFGNDVDMDSIQDNIKTLEDRRKVLAAEIAELETNIEGAEKAIANNREEISRLGDRKAERNRRISNNSRESIITAVDSNWGFVVIGAGRNTGFEPQTRLIVKRDGRVVGEVVPSSIEATQTIAEIDFDTVAPGAVIQPGDRGMLVKPAAN